MATTTSSTTPKPDSIVPYVAYSSPNHKTPNGALYVFGDPNSSKMVLMCPGFPDDHTVFLPFAKALSESEGGGILVGVMCLPGYDDRPEDDVPWESHPKGGFSFDDWVHAVREASKALNGVSTHKNPEFVGIFHDWGVAAGAMWAQRLEQEAKDGTAAASASAASGLLKPHKIVFFDVLLGPSPSMPDLISQSLDWRNVFRQVYCLYQPLMAMCSAIQLYVSTFLAAGVMAFGFSSLAVTRTTPLYGFDEQSSKALYGERIPGVFRVLYMMYPYRFFFTAMSTFPSHHEDWKAMPILYLYGKKKRATFHSYSSLAMLEREEAEKRSLSRAVEVEEAGHWLYVQREDECLKHVLEFINAENTFVS